MAVATAAYTDRVLDSEVIADPAVLEQLAPEWDALAVANRRPLVSPAWMLAAWRHLTPPEAVLRVIAVRERGELVAVAPLFADCSRRGRVDYRVVGAPLLPAGPIAVPGREWEAGQAVAAALDGATPQGDVLVLESGPLVSQWPVALRQQWPGRIRPLLRQYFLQGSPTVSLTAGSLDAWLEGKSANFRGEMRRLRRRIAALGGTVRASSQETLREDILTFLRLHVSRWEGRGGSAIVAQPREWAALFEDIGRAELDDGRFRLLLLELDGEAISAQVFAAAQGEVLHVNGGWNERFAHLKPSLMCIVAGIEDAFARGEERVNLGPGDQHYKLRLADGNDPVAWTMLVVPRARMPLTLARVTSTVVRITARESAKRALSDSQQDRVRALRRAVKVAGVRLGTR